MTPQVRSLGFRQDAPDLTIARDVTADRTVDGTLATYQEVVATRRDAVSGVADTVAHPVA